MNTITASKALDVFLLFIAILLTLFCFYYSRKIKKVKMAMKPKVIYKNSLNSSLSRILLLFDEVREEFTEADTLVNNENQEVKELIDLNDFVKKEIYRIEKNQISLKLINFDEKKKKLNRF